MKLETLDVMKDEDLRAVIGRAEELLKQHDRERKDKALEDARYSRLRGPESARCGV